MRKELIMNKALFVSYCYILVAILLVGCSITKKANDNSRNDVEQIIEKPSPNQCHIQAEIIEVLPIDGRVKGICSENACKAIIKIEKVLAYGSSFSTVLSKEDIIEASFAYTLSPSNEISSMNVYKLPGLKLHDKFEANIEEIDVLNSKKPKFKVFMYSLL